MANRPYLFANPRILRKRQIVSINDLPGSVMLIIVILVVKLREEHTPYHMVL